MPLLLIAAFALSYWLGWLPASIVVPALFLLGFMARARPNTGRTRPRGGYIQVPPNASSTVNRVGTYTNDPTRTAEGNGSFSGLPGEPSGGLATRLTQPKPNRTTAHTYSGATPAGRPGHDTTAANAYCETCGERGTHHEECPETVAV